MNTLENKMIEVLNTLKEDYSVNGLKAEFEAEASRMNELMRLKEIADKCGLKLLIKLGGAEDISHIFDALHLGADGINAPMVETEFALRKYFKAIKKYVPPENFENIEFSVNIETETAYKNIDKILEANESNGKLLSAITVGRVDLTDSLGLTRDDINSQKVYEICEDIFSKAREKKLDCGLGGGISTSAIDFIRRLGEKKLIDKYETRKVIFTNITESKERIDEGILKAVEFEVMWLQNKNKYYEQIYHEDDVRLEMLIKRFKKEIVNSDKTC